MLWPRWLIRLARGKRGGGVFKYYGGSFYPSQNSLNPLRMLSIYWQQRGYPFRQIWHSMNAQKVRVQRAQKLDHKI